MFSVVLLGSGKNYATDLSVPAQCRLTGTVVIQGDLIGRWGGDLGGGYNPFELYGAAKLSRSEPLPPHLVFAELEENEDSACAFLNAYGPLNATLSQHGEPLKATELKRWEKASLNSVAPEEFFRKTLGVAPLLPAPAMPAKYFYRGSLANFWHEQSTFELALRLYTALSSPAAERYRNIRRALARVGVDWAISEEGRYITEAREYVRKTINDRLSLTEPRVVYEIESSALEGVWGCYSLIHAMYLMLFLDIASRSARIVQCEKCGTLFYTELQRGRYCSATCENRARALRAYHQKKGKV
jgi:hypothetical protein